MGDSSLAAEVGGPAAVDDLLFRSPGCYRLYDGRYSYISFQQRGAEELYDHRKDPMEWTDLASNPEYAEIKAPLKALVPRTDEPESPENPD